MYCCENVEGQSVVLSVKWIYYVFDCTVEPLLLSAIKAWLQIPATRSYESHYKNIYDMIEY